jgi:hypothetical protein
VIQLALATFGLSSLWMAMGRSAPARRWAPVVGLIGQPFWFAFAWQTGGWGLLALTCAYTAVYARGAWLSFGGHP